MATDLKSHVTDLFPVPSAPLPSLLIPKRWPGISLESTEALLDVLKDNHTRWHIFFNDSGFHNHIAHRALAYWALGADGDLIEAGYETDSSYQRRAFESPGKITEKNFKDHVGDPKYYSAYLAFFTDLIREVGVAPAIEQYIFAKDANIDASAKKKPDMFNRFLSGLIHPLIHTGYGLEFGLPGIVAEGLAQTAVHSDDASPGIPDDFFKYPSSNVVEDVVSRVKTALHVSPFEGQATGARKGPHVFTVVDRILKDPELGKVQDTGSGMFIFTMKNHASQIIKHMEDWQVDGTNPHNVERKVQELNWLNSVIFGVGGWSEDKPFNADFFHMHLVTSSLFLGTLVSYLKPSSQEHLLRGYLLVSLGWWISRGRPALHISSFYKSTSSYKFPLPSGDLPSPNKDSLNPGDPTRVVTPNPWLPILETSVVHPDDHLPKLQRALAHYSSLYGTREAGQEDFKGTGLEGAEVLDGSLWIRVAGLAAERLGRVREGQSAGKWDRHGFFQAEHEGKK